MIEAKYYRDYRHNYMILQCGREEESRNYQYKILTSGKMKEILKCSIRHLNGQTYFYYDISSKTTLDNFYQGKKMSYEQVRDLLQQLHNIYSKLGSLFLEESKLVLLPEMIFYDLSDRKFIGLYYPDYEADTENPYETLMDYLLDHVDTEDQRLADCMYRIYEMSEEPCFAIEAALQLLDQCEEKEAPAAAEHALPDMMRGLERAEPDNLFPDWETTVPVKKKKSLFYPILAILSVMGIAAALAVYYLYDLSSEESLVLIGCVAAMGVCLLICLGFIGKRARQEEPEAKREQKVTTSKELEDSYEIVKAPVSLENVLSKDMDLCVMEQRVNSAGESDEMPSGEEIGYGNTVFFDLSRIEEHKLYALDKKNKKHIELKQFPCTVGKMAGCVDYVISDDSISRIHARFEKREDRILLTDMNSTNGTYKNGLRMQPSETTEIEPGDEIRFGNLNYCYR